MGPSRRMGSVPVGQISICVIRPTGWSSWLPMPPGRGYEINVRAERQGEPGYFGATVTCWVRIAFFILSAHCSN
jgi:hypothetical protein